MIDIDAIDELAEEAFQRTMLTKKDPRDMNFILPLLEDTSMPIDSFLFHSALFRMYSKVETYETLSPFASPSRLRTTEPDWQAMEGALAELYGGPEAVWGGMFYPATLRAVKGENGRWKKLPAKTPRQQAVRDVHVFRAVYAALGKNDSVKVYMKQRRACATSGWTASSVVAARAAFQGWYASFYEHMVSHTKGCFGDYAMKCILDVGTNTTIKATGDTKSVFPDAVLSAWPVNCPAYTSGIKRLLKRQCKNKAIKMHLKYTLLLFVHARMSKRLGAAHHSVSSTLAQLCWEKRQNNRNNRR